MTGFLSIPAVPKTQDGQAFLFGPQPFHRSPVRMAVARWVRARDWDSSLPRGRVEFLLRCTAGPQQRVTAHIAWRIMALLRFQAPNCRPQPMFCDQEFAFLRDCVGRYSLMAPDWRDVVSPVAHQAGRSVLQPVTPLSWCNKDRHGTCIR